ncbi:MAG: hypothetical protein RMJ33_14920, partial [Saprospiraceae bacterium]|nr:hypothetical protein [Saprospiraceae bacterium]
SGDGQFFKEKVGVDLRFRRLAVSGGLTVNTATNDVELSTTAPQPPTTETLHTSNFTAVNFRLHQVNTTSAAITVTPPSSPAIGDRFAVVDARLTAASNNITISFGSQLIYGQNDTYVINVNGGYAEFIYMGTSTGWVATKG